MKLDTPLVEVAAHLPVEVAERLDEEYPEVQELVLMHVRTFVTTLESRGVQLDPMAYGHVIFSFCVVEIAMAQTVHDLAGQLR